jgi:hypothetical protein
MTDTKYAGNEVLDIMSECAVNRNRSIEKLIRKFVFGKIKTPARVLEFGAGKGEFAFRFCDSKNLELISVETDQAYRTVLNQRLKSFASLDETGGGFDAIYLIDVLEHIEDDLSVLKHFYSKLNSMGRLFIYVPARMELYSAFDKSIGHFRRYSLKELKAKVIASGFKIEEARYHELLGYFASAANRFFSHDGKLNKRALKMYDSVLVRFTNSIEVIINPPFGKSAFISCVKL